MRQIYDLFRQYFDAKIYVEKNSAGIKACAVIICSYF